jgi:23S rRNA pseudouridine2605 synthase
LQKILALAGYGSRRACEQLILDGRVEVDRQVALELGTRADPDQQQIRVDGEPIRIPKPRYYALHKPAGVVTTNRDPAHRLRVIDLIPDGEQLFAVGRLDKASSGLILVTNDGDFANHLAHPRYGIEKTYRVIVAGHPTPQTLQRLRRGVHLADGAMRVVSAQVKSKNKNQTVLRVVLDEGRNREIRRMLASVGHKVLDLQRTAIGSLRLADLPEGAHRPLTRQEVQRFLRRGKPAPRRRGASGSSKSAGGRSKSGGPSRGAGKSRKKTTRSRSRA